MPIRFGSDEAARDLHGDLAPGSDGCRAGGGQPLKESSAPRPARENLVLQQAVLALEENLKNESCTNQPSASAV